MKTNPILQLFLVLLLLLSLLSAQACFSPHGGSVFSWIGPFYNESDKQPIKLWQNPSQEDLAYWFEYQETNGWPNDLPQAAAHGNLTAVKKRVEAGDNINERDAFGGTALDWARLKKHAEIHNYLTQQGALSGDEL